MLVLGVNDQATQLKMSPHEAQQSSLFPTLPSLAVAVVRGSDARSVGALRSCVGAQNAGMVLTGRLVTIEVHVDVVVYSGAVVSKQEHALVMLAGGYVAATKVGRGGDGQLEISLAHWCRCCSGIRAAIGVACRFSAFGQHDAMPKFS